MKRRKWQNIFLLWGGIAAIVFGLIVLAQIPLFFHHSHVRGHQLLKKANDLVRTRSKKNSSKTAVRFSVEAPKPNTLIGEIEIPALNLTAPILQGTGDAELNVAAGHLMTSSFPGQPGTTVIAAHNATWFRHIDQLKKGNLIKTLTKHRQLIYKVSHSKIVRTGTAISSTSVPSIVLETCYPLMPYT